MKTEGSEVETKSQVLSWGSTLEKPTANMGSKISLLVHVYECPLMKCKIWYINGSIFQNFPKLEPKMDDFAQNFAQNRADWYVNPRGATRMSRGYQARPKIHVKGYFFTVEDCTCVT